MPSLEPTKRRLLEEALRENLATMQGVRPAPPGSAGRGWARRGLLIAGALALAASSYVMANAAGSRRGDGGTAPEAAAAELPAAATPATPAALVAAPPAAVTADSVFPPPRVLDPKLFHLGVRRVVIDPGHGGDNRGTVTNLGLVEKDVTLDIANRLASLLGASGFEVTLTRDGDRSLSLWERASAANAARGDIFVSIHVNWIETRDTRAIETYYLGPTDDPMLTALAERENRDSGYSFADFRQLLEKVYADVRTDESKRLAENVQQALYRSLRKVNPVLEDRGVKTAPFIVLVATEMPAVLAEVSCLSNDQEAQLLAQPEYRQNIAQALSEGVRSFASTLEPQKGS